MSDDAGDLYQAELERRMRGDVAEDETESGDSKVPTSDPRIWLHPFVPQENAANLPPPKALGDPGQCPRCDEASCMCCWELCKCRQMRMDHADFKGKAHR